MLFYVNSCCIKKLHMHNEIIETNTERLKQWQTQTHKEKLATLRATFGQ